ncbi:hypothetical protein [Kineococcus glutinatus]|uniref:Proteins of 100 residues with WXG n=1 Tax=Kineococcus glutinatus TaxID=1070872 RepID=A0ABP9HYA3_9ACTN
MPTTLQEQYLQVVQQGQDAVLDAVSSWNKTVQDAAGTWPTWPVQVDPAQVVDQVFEFTHKLITLQHQFAKGLVERSSSLTENLAHTAADAAADVAGGTDSTGL